MGTKRIISLIILGLSLIVITIAMFADMYWPVLLIIGMYFNTLALLIEFTFQKSEGDPTPEHWKNYQEPKQPVTQPIPPPPPPSIKCRICQVEFKNVNQLKDHFIKEHFNMIKDSA